MSLDRARGRNGAHHIYLSYNNQDRRAAIHGGVMRAQRTIVGNTRKRRRITWK
jgi:hypothetical protein